MSQKGRGEIPSMCMQYIRTHAHTYTLYTHTQARVHAQHTHAAHTCTHSVSTAHAAHSHVHTPHTSRTCASRIRAHSDRAQGLKGVGEGGR